MSKSAVHICRHTAGLDDMKRADQRDTVKVLKKLHEIGRFSVFEATETEQIAKKLDWLQACKMIEVTPEVFPWSSVRLTDKGLEAIGERNQPPD